MDERIGQSPQRRQSLQFVQNIPDPRDLTVPTFADNAAEPPEEATEEASSHEMQSADNLDDVADVAPGTVPLDASSQGEFADGDSDAVYEAFETAEPGVHAEGSYAPDPNARGQRARRFIDQKSHAVEDRVTNAGDSLKDAAYRKAPDRVKGASDLQVRAISGFIYIAVSVICVLASDASTVAYLAIVCALCAGEFCYMMRVDAKLVNEGLCVLTATLYPIAVYLDNVRGAVVLTVLFMMALVIWYVMWQRARITDVALTFFGAAYIGISLSSLMLLRASLEDPWGGVLLLVLLMSIWFNDVGAYLVGSRIGKHKMAPFISPKKSWEGFVGGLVVSAAFWCLMTLIPGVNMLIWQAVLFGILCGTAGVLGDLVESRMKRNVGVKDSGTIMPGHGGLFDRSDSLFTASIAALVLLAAGGCITLGW